MVLTGECARGIHSKLSYVAPKEGAKEEEDDEGEEEEGIILIAGEPAKAADEGAPAGAGAKIKYTIKVTLGPTKVNQTYCRVSTERRVLIS